MKKTFKAVDWMRARRQQIDAEDNNLSWREKRNRTHTAVLKDPIFKAVVKKVKVLAVTGAMAGEEAGAYYIDQDKKQAIVKPNGRSLFTLNSSESRAKLKKDGSKFRQIGRVLGLK